MPLYLAIDAGGTKTDFVLLDETQVLSRTRTGTIKRLRVDAATAAERLDEALEALTRATGITMDKIARTCIGTAGESVPLVANWLREAFAARIPGELILLGDVEIALDAAFHGGSGVLVMAGTGSNVAGRTPSGALTTVGGWGPALGDQGSGHRIGEQALRALFLARDESRKTLLYDAIVDFWNLPSADALVEYANLTPGPDTSELATLVRHCAEAGDTLAAEVLAQQGRELGYLVRLMLRRLAQPGWTPQIACTGSILELFEPVRTAMIQAIHAEFPTIEVLPGVIDPIDGAAWRARTGAPTN